MFDFLVKKLSRRKLLTTTMTLTEVEESGPQSALPPERRLGFANLDSFSIPKGGTGNFYQFSSSHKCDGIKASSTHITIQTGWSDFFC